MHRYLVMIMKTLRAAVKVVGHHLSSYKFEILRMVYASQKLLAYTVIMFSAFLETGHKSP